MEKSLSYQARRLLLQRAEPQYREASPSEKRTLLEAFVATTGYHPTYARWLLNHSKEVQQTLQRPRPRQYGPEVQHALFLVWHAANRICTKRLIPFLPTLVEALERHEHLHLTEECRSQLLSMSAATADRLLRSQRKRGQRGLSTTRAGTLLKQQIPIRFTRGRPYQKRDQCFVEQKNGAIVRQVVGYDRFVGEHAYRQLMELYRALRMYVNYFQPSMKLLSKQRDGKKVRYVYDPAKTPLQRLLLSRILSGEKQDELSAMAQSLDPLRLFEQLEQLQKALFSCAVEGNPFVSNAPSLPIRVFSAQQCTMEVGPFEGSPPDSPAGLAALHHEQEKRKRVLGWRRTHKDPFEGEWDQIFSWLVANPERSSGDIFRELQRCSPGRYQPLQMRTLQRGMRNIRVHLLQTLEEQWQEEVI